MGNNIIFQHTHKIGRDPVGRSVEITVELRQNEKGITLSMCGDVWQKNRSDIIAGGQLEDHIFDYLKKYLYPRDKIKRMVEVWKEYHLNDMNAGCEHQRAEQWGEKELILPSGEKKRSGWVYEKEHPEGVLSKPCPVCGYQYGSAWLFRAIPEEIIQEIKSW